MEGFMKYFIFVLFLFFFSCQAETSKERFIRVGCVIRELPECDHSETTREFCEDFLAIVYSNNPLYESKECLDCLESLGCEMWTHDEKCKLFCEE